VLRERAAAIVGGALGDPTGGDDDDKIVDWFKELAAQWGRVFSEGIGGPLDLLAAKLEAGIIDKSAARTQAEAMLANWRDTYEQLLASSDPLEQQIALWLSPHIANIDEFISDMDKDLANKFSEKLIDIKLKVQMGLDPAVATTMLEGLKAEITQVIQDLGDAISPELEKLLNTILNGITTVMASLKPEDMSQALESILRQVIQKGADTISDALASIINPSLGVDLANAMGQLFSGMMQIMGDSMIQLGIASILLQDWFGDMTNPVNAAKMIAGGILLKTLAKAIGGKVKAAASGGSSGGAAGSINYPQFSPGAYGDKRSWYVEINAMDAASFEQTIARNPAAFGRQIASIAREDGATGGQAHGAFVPA